MTTKRHIWFKAGTTGIYHVAITEVAGREFLLSACGRWLPIEKLGEAPLSEWECKRCHRYTERWPEIESGAPVEEEA